MSELSAAKLEAQASPPPPPRADPLLPSDDDVDEDSSPFPPPRRRLARLWIPFGLRRRRRVVLVLGFLGFLWLLQFLADRLGEDEWTKEDRAGRCSFVSPAEAYWQSISRIKDHDHNYHGGRVPLTSTNMTFEANGQLEYSKEEEEGGEHPIPRLLELAEARWKDLLEREAQTLERAVAEYEGRWGRRPPKGFDAWFNFTQTHNVLLPSSYHPLLQSTLAPYHAIAPKELLRRAKIVEGFQETFVLDIKKRRPKVAALELKPGWEQRWPGTRSRAVDQINLMAPFLQHLSPVRATFSLHDGPSIFPLLNRTLELRALSERGEYDENAEKEEDVYDVNWDDVCGIDVGKFNQTVWKEGMVEGIDGKSFIYDRVTAEDVCLNPRGLTASGIYLEPHTKDCHPRPHSMLLPMLSFAKTTANGDILAAPLEQFNNGPGIDPSWDKKANDRMVWRGSTTGMEHRESIPWRISHRPRLALLTNAQPSYDALTRIIVSPAVDPVTGRTTTHRTTYTGIGIADLNKWYFDIKFTGRAIQCEGGEGDQYGEGAGGTCLEMMEELPFAAHQSMDDLNEFKYLIDVDGNSWSARFRRLMSTNSLVLKATVYPEWYSDGLIPWYHYVPLKSDYTDIYDTLAFFRGTPDHPGGFDDVAKALARNGKCFVKKMWRKEDLQAYMFLLYLELARLLSLNRDEMDFEPLGASSALP